MRREASWGTVPHIYELEARVKVLETRLKGFESLCCGDCDMASEVLRAFAGEKELEDVQLTEAEAMWALWALGQTGQAAPKPLPTKEVVNAALRKLRALAREVDKCSGS